MFKFIKNLIKYTVRLVFIAALLGTVYLFWPELCTLAGQPYQGDDGLRDKIKKDLVSMFDNFDVVMDPIADFFRPAPKTIQEAFLQRDPINCARYYANVRRDSVNADEVFIEEIIPIMENWNYSEICNFTNEIKNTPAYDYAIPYYCEIRDALVEQIYNDFDDFLEQTMKQYYDDVIPMIVQEANNQFEDDLMSVMDKYEDAKSWYQFWESEEELEKAWKQVIGNKYTGIINGYISQYYNGLTSFYDDYSDIVGCSINLSMDRIEFKFPTPKQIKQYVETENKKWVRDFLLDAGSAAATFTGPAAPYIQAALQGYGNTTTGIEMIKDFTGYSEEQKMIAQIEQDFDYLLCHHLKTPVIKHICTNHILARNAILEQMIKYERYLTIPDSEYTINEIINSIEQQ